MNEQEQESKQAIDEILGIYRQVASGETKGAGGTYNANGRASLAEVSIPVGVLERLAHAHGHKVWGRDYTDRHG